jgi:dihydrodipicolinate synthase/N-acetylneuraminate lyase
MSRKFGRREFARRMTLAALACRWLPRAAFAGSTAPPTPKPYRGIFAILQTPFDLNGQFDVDDLDREVNFCVRAGAHGLVWPQLAGEFYKLTEAERLRGAETIVRAAQGRSPVVIGVQSPTQELSLRLARHAEEKGADAIISLPPYVGHVGLDAVSDYYRALAAAVKLPIFIQNSGGSWGPALSTSFVIQLARENSRLGYIKEEVSPATHRLGEYARSGAVSGVFSGNAGRNLLNELARGSSGTMPACEFIDVDVEIYNLASSGKLAEARGLFQKLLPMINLEETYGVAFAKTVLVRRGIFKTAKLRDEREGTLDEIDSQELDAWWKNLAPFLKA